MQNNQIIKVVLAILLLLCLADMPYGYYQLTRMICLVGFSFLAYRSFKEEKVNLAFVYLGLAILFQPIVKISLGRNIWNLIDIIVALTLLVSFALNERIKGPND